MTEANIYGARNAETSAHLDAAQIFLSSKGKTNRSSLNRIAILKLKIHAQRGKSGLIHTLVRTHQHQSRPVGCIPEYFSRTPNRCTSDFELHHDKRPALRVIALMALNYAPDNLNIDRIALCWLVDITYGNTNDSTLAIYDGVKYRQPSRAHFVRACIRQKSTINLHNASPQVGTDIKNRTLVLLRAVKFTAFFYPRNEQPTTLCQRKVGRKFVQFPPPFSIFATTLTVSFVV